MTFLSEMEASYGFVPAEAAREKGRDLAERYNAAEPFPHIVIDDFLPSALLDKCLAEFPKREQAENEFDRDQERFKAQFNPDIVGREVSSTC